MDWLEKVEPTFSSLNAIQKIIIIIIIIIIITIISSS